MEYKVRRYEPADRTDVLWLLNKLFRGDIANVEDRWFDWRFHDNPYADDVPMTVVEKNGHVIGLKSTLPIPLAMNGQTERAVLHGDVVVHPDHRRKGVFSRLVEWDYERLLASEVVLAYGTPNENSLSAFRSHDSLHPIDRGILADIPEYYRVQNLNTVLDSHPKWSSFGRMLSRFGGAKGISRRRGPNPAASSRDVTVKRHAEIPVKLLASLSDEQLATKVHAVRDDTFYRWRFSNPRYEYTAYTVEQNGETRAGAIVEEETAPSAGKSISRIADVRSDTKRTGRTDILKTFAQAIERDVDSDILVTRGVSFPQSQLQALDLHSVASYLYTQSGSSSKFLARPIADDVGEWKLHGLDLSDPSNWCLMWCDSQIA